MPGCLVSDREPSPDRGILPFLANNRNHRNLNRSAAFPGMIRLCIAGDHASAALHSRGLDICRKSIVILGPSYAKKENRGPTLCKAKIIPGERGAGGRCRPLRLSPFSPECTGKRARGPRPSRRREQRQQSRRPSPCRPPSPASGTGGHAGIQGWRALRGAGPDPPRPPGRLDRPGEHGGHGKPRAPPESVERAAGTCGLDLFWPFAGEDPGDLHGVTRVVDLLGA